MFFKSHIYIYNINCLNFAFVERKRVRLAKIIFANLFDYSAYFIIIYESHYTTSVNFYFYLQYF